MRRSDSEGSEGTDAEEEEEEEEDIHALDLLERRALQQISFRLRQHVSAVLQVACAFHRTTHTTHTHSHDHDVEAGR
jgi:hypothetical protein